MRRPRLAAALLVSWLLAAGLASPAAADAAPGQARTALQHVVLVTQDNRSFDHYFGTRRGVEGIPKGTCQPSGGTAPCVAPFHLTDSANLTPLNDARRYLSAQLHGGKMDAFVSAYKDSATDGSLAMGYYGASDLPYYYQLADEFVLLDHYFSAAPANGVANRYFGVTAASTPRGQTAVPADGWPAVTTIFDRLSQAGVSWKVYVQGYGKDKPAAAALARDRARVPLLGMASNQDPSRLAGHVVGLDAYYNDAAANSLPAVSYVVATGPTDRSPAAPRTGEDFVKSLVTSLQSSRAWSTSALLLDYDSSGGWYDHVVPPAAQGAPRGARVPALLVSPFARPGTVNSQVLDAAAGLRLIEQNWSLRPPTSPRTKSEKELRTWPPRSTQA